MRRCLKYKPRETTEAIAGAITGLLTAPGTLLLGRYHSGGQLQYVGRTTTLARATSQSVAALLSAAGEDHSWTGCFLSVGWGGRETLDVSLVEPRLVVEVGVDVAMDCAGRRNMGASWTM